MCLPAAYRAKRIALVGDPSQLRPVITSNPKRVRHIAVKSGLNPDRLQASGQAHDTGSAYAAFRYLDGASTLFLDEHYRCHPRIAAWFNNTFYGGKMRVLTDVSSMSSTARGLEWQDIEGVTQRDNGNRLINRQEAERCAELVSHFQKSGFSIGVVTPFVGQKKLIESMLEQELKKGPDDEEKLKGPDDEEKLIVGTAHALQGQERDVVIFSTVLALNTSDGAAAWVEDDHYLINVAVSRARRHLVVLGHPSAAQTHGVNTLASLRRASQVDSLQTSQASQLHSEAERLLFEGLQGRGIHPQLKVMVEGYELDMVVRLGPGRDFDLEVDGGHHRVDEAGRQRRQDMFRDRTLTAMGWQVKRIPAWRCHRDLDSVLDELQGAIAGS